MSIDTSATVAACPKGNKNRQFLNAFHRILTCIGINKTYPWYISIFPAIPLYFSICYFYTERKSRSFFFFFFFLILARIYTHIYIRMYLIQRINPEIQINRCKYTRLLRNISPLFRFRFTRIGRKSSRGAWIVHLQLSSNETIGQIKPRLSSALIEQLLLLVDFYSYSFALLFFFSPPSFFVSFSFSFFFFSHTHTHIVDGRLIDEATSYTGNDASVQIIRLYGTPA